MSILPGQCVKQIIYETENAINQVNINQQEAIRYLATKNLQRILSQQNHRTMDYKQGLHNAKLIKLKLQHNNATIIEADEGKTLVVMHKHDLDDKVNTFINENVINKLKADPTQRMQKMTQNTIKQCTHIIDPNKRKYITQMHPQAPNLKLKIKIRKPATPIRPVLNIIHAPTHKLAQHIHHKLKDLINLKYEFNFTNTTQFAEGFTNLKLILNHKLLTMDIKDLYVKIPINTTLNIVNTLLKRNRIDDCSRIEPLFALRLIIIQNYFQYEGKFYKPNSGVAMGSPLSGTLAEIFLQDLEQQRIKHLLEDGNIIYYNRYITGIK
jgi:hypothetical protein